MIRVDKKGLKAVAIELASSLNIGDVIYLNGDLGVGKTTFASYVIRWLIGPDCYVTSPTFNVLQQYRGRGLTIFHFDLYRIRDSNELVELGIEDAASDGISIVEWPELIREYWPRNRKVVIDLVEDLGNSRYRNINILDHRKPK